MKRIVLYALLPLLAACATAYPLSQEGTSRIYRASGDEVWEAALAAVHDADLTLVRTEREKGRIRAHSGASDRDLKGYALLVVVRKAGPGHVRVDATAEPLVPNGKVEVEPRYVTGHYRRALDRRMGLPGT